MALTAQLGIAPAAIADPGSPLSVTKTATPNPVASGAQLTYTIVIQNIGGAKVDNIVLTDQINGVGVIQSPPALPQLTITSTKGSCTQGGPNGNLVTCNAGSMVGREVWTVTIRGQVTAPNNTTLNNTASVTGTKSAQTFTTTGSTSVIVSGGTGGGDLPDLTINKTGPTSVAPNTPFTYTLTINNIGTANTSNVLVVDTLPAGVTFVSTSTTSLFTCSESSGTVTCDGGAVNIGQNASIAINVISPGAPGQITNTAVVDPNNTIAESNESNNTSASVNTSVGGPPPAPLLSIFKTDGTPDINVSWDTGAGPDPVNPGEQLTYKIQVTNNATSRADDVRITDTTQGLEASSIVVSMVVVDGAIGVGGGCQVVAPHAICEVRSLQPGGTITMTVRGMVIAAAGSTLFNTATVHGNIKNVGVTNTATEATTVRPSVDLTITKVDSPDPACARTWPRDNNAVGELTHLALDPTPPAPPGSSGATTPLLAEPVCLGGLTYSFVIGNSGNGNATNVTVRDQLPAGLILDSYETSAGFACSVDAGNAVTCTGGAIDAADTETLTFRLVAPPTVGSITNTVVIDPNNAIFEPDETNNTASATTTISTGVDLVIWKGDDTFDTVDTDPTDEDPPGGPVDDQLDEGFDPIATNATQTYTIIVDNIGPQDVTGIKVRDVLPAGTKFLSFSATNGFTCTHDGSTFGGNVTCIGGHLLGTAAEFYQRPGTPPPLAPGDDRATIVIKVFATTFVQPIMHNEVRVDPDGEIAEINELNNFAFQNTTVGVGNDDQGAFNQLTIDKTQTDPSVPPDPSDDVATNGILIYELKVSNLGTDPVSAILVKDFLPAGSRFIEARDTDTGPTTSDAFFCFHDGAALGGIVTCVGGDLSGSLNKIPDPVLPATVPTFRTIRIKVFAPNTPGTYVNIAVVDPDNTVPEGNEFDNDDAVFTDVVVGGSNMFNELNLTKEQTSPATTCGIPALPCVATSSVVEYTLVVKNDGSDPAFQVLVRDTLPAGFSFISADDTSAGANAFQCTNSGNVVECSSAMLAASGNPGSSRTITIRAFSATQPGIYTNQAVVDPANAIPEGNETNNTAQAKTRVVVGDGFIDLRITKCDQQTPQDDDPGCAFDSDPVVPSGNVHYILTVSNNGTDPAFNVKVTDSLPAGTTFVSAEDTNPGAGAFSCVFSSGVITCTGGTLDGSQDLVAGVDTSRTIDVVIKAPAAKGPITNQASIDPDNAIAESNETNNFDAETTNVVPRINLTLDKTGPDTAHQNDVTEYVITVKNEAPTGDGQTAFNVHVHDALPVGLIPLYVEATPSNMICTITENPVNVVDCVGDMSAIGADPDSSTVTITIGVFVTAKEGPLDNEACVDPTDALHPEGLIIESNEGDNCKTKTTEVLKLSPDLLVNKSTDTTTATPGQTITYTVTVSNTGDAAALGPITVTDKIDVSKVDFVSASGTNGFDPCTFTTPNIECPGGGLAVGESTTITVKVKVKVGATGSVLNEASVPENTAFDPAAAECSAPDPNCDAEGAANTASTNANNKDTVTTPLGGTGIDLVMLSLEDDPDPTAPGGIVTYTAKVSNNGTADVTGATVRLTLPATGLNHVISSASNGFTCSFLFPNIDCIGNLPSGGTTEVKLVTNVTASAPPDTSVTVTAEVDPANTIVEDDETNNDKSQTTTVSASCATACVDLVASPIVASPDPVHAGDTVTFIVGVGNAGDTATGSFDIDLKLTGTGFDFDGGGFDASQPSDDYSATAGASTGFDCIFGFPAPAGTVRCTGDLNGGQGVLIILKVHVTSPATDNNLTLQVTADSTTSETEFSELNNEATVGVGVLP